MIVQAWRRALVYVPQVVGVVEDGDSVELFWDPHPDGSGIKPGTAKWARV